MDRLRGGARRRAQGRDHRDPGSVRGERPHRGRHPPLRRRRLPRGRAAICSTAPVAAPRRYDDFSKVMPLFEGVTDDGVLADVDAAIDHLRRAGLRSARIGIVGFCFGGRVTFLVARATRARRCGRLLRRRDRHRPAVSDCRPLIERGGVPADAVARSLRRPRQGHPGRRRRGAARALGDASVADRGRPLRRRRPRLPLRRPRRLPRGLGQGRVAADPRLVRHASRLINHSPPRKPLPTLGPVGIARWRCVRQNRNR